MSFQRSHLSLDGNRYTRLVVKEYYGRNRDGNNVWLCECDCGNLVICRSGELKCGKTKSCGCYSRDSAAIRFYKHGGKTTRLYNIWKGMRKRCINENSRCFEDYGGRDIIICPEWDNFALFREWSLSHGYKDFLTIDRIDNNGNYCPQNCRWATNTEQQNNKRNNHKITVDGETKNLFEWVKILGVCSATVIRRSNNGTLSRKSL